MAKAKYRLTKAFHPKAYRRGVYAVRFKQTGKPFLDKYTKSTMVKAGSRSQAIVKAKKELKI